MLERVSAKAESAASLFIRNLENPYRSTRILDPRFWQNRNTELATASWWPGYLQHIRDVPQGSLQHSRDGVITFLVSPQSAFRSGFESSTARSSGSYTAERRKRSYTVSTSKNQKPQRIYDAFGLTEEIVPEEEITNNKSGIGENEQTHMSDRKYKSKVLPDESVEDEGDLFDTNRNVDLHSTKASRKTTQAQKAQSSQVESWDLDSSLASLVTSDRIISGGSHTPAPAGSPVKDDFDEDKFVRSEPRSPPAESTFKHDSDEDKLVRSEPLNTEKKKAVKIKKDEIILQAEQDKNRNALHKYMSIKTKASDYDFDEVWRLFTQTKDQELDAAFVFRYLAKTKHSRDLNRAIQAFKMISVKDRTYSLYRKALDVQLKRYQHRDAIDLAFDAQARNFNLLPTLLHHFIENLLWNSAVELIRRNDKLRRDIKKEAVEYKILIRVCHDIPDLFFKVTSLAERLRANDATLTQNRALVERLCKNLILECSRSSQVIGRMTREGILALIELGTNFGATNLHRWILSTMFKHAHKGEMADLALFVYRNYRLHEPEEKIDPYTFGNLFSICGAARTDAHVYGYLLREFEIHRPKDEMFGAYQRVLTYCARQGQVDNVEHFLQTYISKYGKPKLQPMLNPLIHVRAISGDTTNARKQFDRLQNEFGLEPTLVSWNMLLLAHARSNNDLSTFEIFDDMLANGVQPDSYTYGTLLAICADHADSQTAMEVLAEAREFGVTTNVTMINTVVEACLANDDDRQAVAFVYATSESGTQESLTRLWNSLMRHYAKKGDTVSMLRTRNGMTRYNVKPDDMTYASLITDLVSKKKTMEAIQLLREMHFQERMPVTLLHYSIILHGLIAEQNRDMATIIFNEIKQRFPGMAESIDIAIMNLQGQRKSMATSGNDASLQLDLLSDMLAEASSQQDLSYRTKLNEKPGASSTIWFQMFESLLLSLIRNRSYDQAEVLLNNLASSQWLTSTHEYESEVSTKLSLARMDLAIARGRWNEVGNVWQTLFQDAKRRYQPLKIPSRTTRELLIEREHMKNQEMDGTNASLQLETPNSAKPSRPIQKPWQFVLSGSLNRYMTSMSNNGRIDELWKFIYGEFQPAGFQLSARNWNRYIQILCQATDHRHHVVAFRLTEQHLIKRAQNWRLLTRGLFRRFRNEYTLEASKEGKRPVIQRKSSYGVTDRIHFMAIQPSVKIPTYLTFVHLAKVLQQAAERANIGKPRLMTAIGGVAPKTKRFLQQMPYMRDRFQGTILRGLQPRPDEEPRPRSELSRRKLAERSGILGSKSPFDHLPAELLQDIETFVAPRDDVRQVLKRDQNLTFSPQQQRDIVIGEQADGQINRGPAVLAAKGRLETPREIQRRVSYEERQRLRSIAKLRQDMRTKRLVEDSYGGRQDIPIVSVAKAHEEPIEKAEIENYSRLLAQVCEINKQQAERCLIKPSENQPEANRDEKASKLKRASVAVPFENLSVSQQLERLEAYRKATAEHLQTHPPLPEDLSIQGLAIHYANIRRVRRTLVARQTKQVKADVQRWGVENFSDQTLSRIYHSQRLLQKNMLRNRRAIVLRQEQALKAGKRLPPMPKTRKGIRRSRSTNVPPIRFVPDLKRKKWRYQVRRGLMPDIRLEKFRNNVFVSAEEMLMRRHPALTEMRKRHPNFGRKLIRRRDVAALPLGRPPIKGNFEPLSEV